MLINKCEPTVQNKINGTKIRPTSTVKKEREK